MNLREYYATQQAEQPQPAENKAPVCDFKKRKLTITIKDIPKTAYSLSLEELKEASELTIPIIYLLQAYGKPTNDSEYWEQVIKDTDTLYRCFENSPNKEIGQKIIFDIIHYLEAKAKAD